MGGGRVSRQMSPGKCQVEERQGCKDITQSGTCGLVLVLRYHTFYKVNITLFVKTITLILVGLFFKIFFVINYNKYVMLEIFSKLNIIILKNG